MIEEHDDEDDEHDVSFTADTLTWKDFDGNSLE